MPHRRLAAAATAGLLLAGCTAHGSGVDGRDAPSNASMPPVRHIAPGQLLDTPATNDAPASTRPSPAPASSSSPTAVSPGSDTPARTPASNPPAAFDSAAGTAVAEDLPDDPAAVAMGAVAAGLHAEGLDIVELTGRHIGIDDGHVTVRVTVAHTAGGGHPYQSVYDLQLEADRDGWHIRRIAQAQLP